MIKREFKRNMQGLIDTLENARSDDWVIRKIKDVALSACKDTKCPHPDKCSETAVTNYKLKQSNLNKPSLLKTFFFTKRVMTDKYNIAEQVLREHREKHGL